jgi:Arc/MetJ family transcription regulator
MKITVDINETLLKKVMELTGTTVKSRAVNKALNDYIRLKRKEALLNLPGKIRVEENWKELREAERSELRFKKVTSY